MKSASLWKSGALTRHEVFFVALTLVFLSGLAAAQTTLPMLHSKLREEKDPRNLIQICRDIIEQTKKLEMQPLITGETKKIADKGAQQLRANDISGAQNSYFQALLMAPHWPEPYLGLGAVYEGKAFAEEKAAAGYFGLASSFYDLFLAAAAQADPRKPDIVARIAKIKAAQEKLSAPPHITKTSWGSWPFGRPAVSVGVGFGIGNNFAGNESLKLRAQQLNQQMDGSWSLPTYFADATIRILPFLCIGGMLHGGFLLRSEDNDVHVKASGKALFARLSFFEEVQEGAYSDAFIDLGFGGLEISGWAQPNSVVELVDADRITGTDGSVYHVGIGMNYLANFFGFTIGSRFHFGSVEEVKRFTDGTVLTTSDGKPLKVDYTAWEALYVRVMFSI